MKIIKHRKLHIIIAFSIFLLVVSNIPGTAQEEKKLVIYLFDPSAPSYEPLQTNIFYEGKKYDIAVTHENESTYAYNVLITITALEESYITSFELPSVTIQTPSYEECPRFVITASKDGYKSAEVTINVLKGRLSIATDRGTVEEKESFSVTITDQNNNKVENAIVYLDTKPQRTTNTNQNGIAYLDAPEVDRDAEITIMTFKDGYKAGSTTIRVENIEETFTYDFLSKIFEIEPVILSIALVVFSMLFVTFRKRLFSKEKKERSKDKRNVLEKNTTKDQSQRKVEPLARGPRIEEIRIHKPEVKKTTRYITEGRRETCRSSVDWFNGADYIRYKIGELTGEIDEEKADKWFEGVDHIKSKLDKKLKKSYRDKKISG